MKIGSFHFNVLLWWLCTFLLCPSRDTAGGHVDTPGHLKWHSKTILRQLNPLLDSFYSQLEFYRRCQTDYSKHQLRKWAISLYWSFFMYMHFPREMFWLQPLGHVYNFPNQIMAAFGLLIKWELSNHTELYCFSFHNINSRNIFAPGILYHTIHFCLNLVYSFYYFLLLFTIALLSQQLHSFGH